MTKNETGIWVLAALCLSARVGRGGEQAGGDASALRGIIISGSDSGKKPRIWVDFLGRRMRGKLLGADEDGIRASVMGSEMRLPWEKLPPARLAAIATKLAGTGPDHLVIARYLLRNSFPDKARQACDRAVGTDASLSGEAKAVLRSLERGDQRRGPDAQELLAVKAPDRAPEKRALGRPRQTPGPGERFINIGIGGGGTMMYPSMSPYDPDLMQTSCDMGGRYVSNDGGDAWRLIPFWEMIRHTGRAVFDPRNMYIRGCGGIQVSSDKGATWSVIKEGFPWKDKMSLMKTVGKDRQALAVGTASGLWLSSDAARTWELSREGKCTDLVFLGDTLFLSGDKTLHMSEDVGKTWKDITPEQAQGKQIASIAAGQGKGEMVLLALLEDRKTLLTSTDWGRTWSVGQVGGENSRRPSILGMVSNQTRVVFITRKFELWRSKDSGKTWARCIYARNGIAPGVKESEFCGRHKWGLGQIHFAIDAVNTNRVIVTTMSDLFYSQDAGSTWKQMYNVELGRTDANSKDFFCQTRGLTMTSAWQYRFDPFDRRYQYICYTDFGFLRSIDGGRSWATSPPANSTYAIEFDPKVPGRIYGAASGTHDIPGWGFVNDKRYGSGRVVVSDDRADTWKTLGKGYPNIPCTHLALDRTRSKGGNLVFWATFYGRGGGGLYRSDDSGQNWRKVEGIGYPRNKHFLRVKVHPKTGDIYVSISGIKKGMDFFQAGGFWRSSDDGRTWTDIAKSLDLRWQKGFTFHAEDTGTIYLAASTAPKFRQGGVYKTTDSGKNWKHIFSREHTGSLLHTYSVDIHPTKRNIVYACSGAGLYCSQDEGATWKRMNVPHFRTTHVTVDPDDPETIYVTTFGGGTWKGYYLP